MSTPETPLPPEELKKCPYCGHMTSIHANFCYYCARELVARPERPSEGPEAKPVNWLVVGAIILVVLFVMVGIAIAFTAK